MADTPAWKDDFPISWVDDHFVTRREFTRSLVGVSCASFAASTALTVRAAATRREGPFPAVLVGEWDELPVGGSKVFGYPEADNPCLLIRVDVDAFVAFQQKCTHLGCPVLYEAEERRLHCPCHEGFFSASDGRVLGGPPPRPLARVDLETRGREIWAVGVRP